MAQVYQKSHYDYDGMQRSERRPSRGPVHTVDRGVPYVAYSTRPDPRNESRTYVLPTPIHDIGEDSDSGSARKRTSMAVSISWPVHSCLGIDGLSARVAEEEKSSAVVGNLARRVEVLESRPALACTAECVAYHSTRANPL